MLRELQGGKVHSQRSAELEGVTLYQNVNIPTFLRDLWKYDDGLMISFSLERNDA